MQRIKLIYFKANGVSSSLIRVIGDFQRQRTIGQEAEHGYQDKHHGPRKNDGYDV